MSALVTLDSVSAELQKGRGKFLKKLQCCVSGKYKTDHLQGSSVSFGFIAGLVM